jgi:hypothetical protein
MVARTAAGHANLDILELLGTLPDYHAGPRGFSMLEPDREF